MKLTNLRIEWIKSNHGYNQGIKKRNYRHREGENYYNGFGGAYMNVDMELNIYGKDVDGKEQKIDVRYYLLKAIGKSKMSKKIYNILEKSLPNEIEIDDDTNKISSESLLAISSNYKKRAESSDSI